MAYLKKQWKPFTIVTVLVLGSVGLWLYRGSASGAAVSAVPAIALFQQSYPPPTDVERSQVDQLLADIDMDRESMIALNLSGEQAEDLLATVRTFNTDNRTTLDTRLASLAAARLSLRTLETSIRHGTAGQDPEGQKAQAIADVAAAKTSYDDTLASLRTSVNALLSQSQRSTWTNIQSGWDGGMPLQMLALDASQKTSVAAAKRRFDHALAEAQNDQERSNAASTWNTDVDGILTTDQETVCASYVSHYVEASQNVATAFATVMPKE